MAIDQQWVVDISGNDRKLIDTNFSDVINDIDTSAAGQIGRLDDPEILFGVLLLLPLEMLIEIAELVRYHIRVG